MEGEPNDGGQEKRGNEVENALIRAWRPDDQEDEGVADRKLGEVAPRAA